ncbi:uncharacterized protein ISCGN_006845 [Ixodes scapularis]
MEVLHQLACAFTLSSLILPDAGLEVCSSLFLSSLPSSSVEVYSLLVLCKLGQRMAELEADWCFLGFCSRERYIEDSRWPYLSSLTCDWTTKKKVLTAYRNSLQDQLKQAWKA